MNKIVKAAQALDVVSKLKKEGRKIVLAGGCFDILHIGHINFLEKAKTEGDVLILLLESDAAIKKLKGENRPINTQENRAKVLSAVEYVDLVITLDKPFKNEDYRNLVSEIKPDVIAVTQGDQNLDEKTFQAKAVGGVVEVVLNHIPEHSTTKILEYF